MLSTIAYEQNVIKDLKPFEQFLVGSNDSSHLKNICSHNTTPIATCFHKFQFNFLSTKPTVFIDLKSEYALKSSTENDKMTEKRINF